VELDTFIFKIIALNAKKTVRYAVMRYVLNV
jgi:hypothetical protein